MSLPSIPVIANEFGIDLKSEITPETQEKLLVEAMRRDLPLAVALLHRKAHEAESASGADWLEDPNSPIGKQLVRLHASDALRPLASKHFCHGKELTFINCCAGRVGERPANLLLLQIQTQAGPIAYADC